MHKKKKDDLAEIDQIEIAPLSDEDMTFVMGGWGESCSTYACSSGDPEPPPGCDNA
jgi:hypothetical protein